MSDRAQPLIGPGVPGPARISYLPRFWLRSCLRRVDLLRADAAGPDAAFEDALSTLTAGTDLSHLAEDLPTYVEFERRILAGSPPLDENAIASFNAAIQNIQLRDAEAAALRARVGLDRANERNARMLIDLDTWRYLHDLVAAGNCPEIVPAVSSTSTGPLGATHLPRMWVKALLTAAGCIPPGYNSGVGGGDTFTVTRLGLDMETCIGKISTERPTYLEFEAWVRQTGRNVDEESIGQYNIDAAQRDKPSDMAAEIRRLTGLDDSSMKRTIILNDLEDWYAIHLFLIGLPQAHSGTPWAAR